MIGWMKDLPDWTIGAALAGSVWFGTAYVGLAPRAMNNDLEVEVYPACLAKLEAEQDQALSRKEADAKRSAENDRDDLRRQLNSKLRDLNNGKLELEVLEGMQGILNESGLGALVPLPKVSLPSSAEVDQTIRSIQGQIAALDVPIDISLPRLPSSELMKTCGCAGLQAMAGKRMSYAISLASFRLISPKEISSLKQDVSETLRFDACGQMPWEAY